jgi:hypothetical protein
MRTWHNLFYRTDIVEYIEKEMYGVMEYPPGVKIGDVRNGNWLATMMSPEDVDDYIMWCDMYCDKVIWNLLTRRPDQDEWK